MMTSFHRHEQTLETLTVKAWFKGGWASGCDKPGPEFAASLLGLTCIYACSSTYMPTYVSSWQVESCSIQGNTDM